MRAPDFWDGSRPADAALGALLSPFGYFYGLSVRLRKSRAHPFRPKARVICVGNLTAGGTGKTPVAIAVARMLAARGKKVTFLSRGYGGRESGPVRVDPGLHSADDVGDEALLLAAHAPAIVSRDRAAGARLADSLHADVIVMDDGFQNFQIEKDLALLVIDAATGFGNGRLIPAGPLRERAADGLARADALILIGDGAPKLPPFPRAILRARITPAAPEALSGREVFAFAGIGRPEKFFAMLRGLGARVLGAEGFADHHVFSPVELSALRKAAESLRALLVTTEKDFVRIEPKARAGIVPVPVQAVFSEPAALGALLDRIHEARD